MKTSTLPNIEIPGSTANQFGVTVKVGPFEFLKVEVPPILGLPPFGFMTITVFLDGAPVGGGIVDSDNPARISIEIPPVFVRCCWQTIQYRIDMFSHESSVLYVLNEGVKSK
ncbi:hypothetical protein C4J95_4087 [Pseudomonas orientalis]|uniref:hypothetical protein n=1 Tax=Pseudomonas orientalis TaxID=76758 RepID=UPI000F58D171|nr:hypothetical protein [Pseudomonas orientalis]AZF01522.1 hypothetical protein C4J95_4087 [Pseudomonas orientalis]